MSYPSSNPPNKPPRFTTTAIINCSAYPPGTSQKRIITQTSSLEDTSPPSSSSGRNFTASNGHAKLSESIDQTFPRKVQVGESIAAADHVTHGKPFTGVPSAPPPPPPPSQVKSTSSNGENASSLPLFPSSRFAQTTNSLPRGYSPKYSGATNVSGGLNSRSVGGTGAFSAGNFPAVGVGHHVVVPGHSAASDVADQANKVPKAPSFASSGAMNPSAQAPSLRSMSQTSHNSNINSSNINSGISTSNNSSLNNAGKPKVDPSDPQVRKLVYNMYRGLLDNKHAHSNNIIDNKPSMQVDMDEGVKNRVLCMMKQQEELKTGKVTAMNGPAGPPPPPPPPPFVVPGATPPPVVQPPAAMARPSPRPGPQIPLVAPPAALAGAMMKDKKPFTYTPGGLDLSEIRSPRMQRRLSRNAALEGVKPSPLAQPQASSPGIPSPAASSGIAVQVLPMPGMSMAKTPSTPPASAKSKEPPPLKKNVCGPAPPPPPFAIGMNGAQSNDSVPVTTPQTPTKVPVSPVSPVNQLSVQGDVALNTPSSPPFSSQSSDPRSPSPSLVSTESGGPNVIPVPPPIPPPCATARRASQAKNESQSLPPSDLQSSANERLYMTSANADNVSPALSVATESNRSVGSSSMAVEDETTSYREDSVTPSLMSNPEKASADNQYSSNESLLKQISALEQITARHQSKSENSGSILSSKENVMSNAPLEANVPVQPILRLSTKSKSSEAEERSKREAEEKAKRHAEEKARIEEEKRRSEEQARLEAQKREMEQERIKKEREQEQIRQKKEQERIRQEEEEKERIRQERENERIRQEKELERAKREKEQMEEERRQREEARIREEKEKSLKIELEKKKKLEDEQRKQEALERQRKEEAQKQEMELQRLEAERQKSRDIEIQRQRDIEWKKQEEEWRKLRELEVQQQRELENHKFEDETSSAGQNFDFGYQDAGVSPHANLAKNRRLRQGSVPVQLRSSALSNTSANQRHSSSEAQHTAQDIDEGDINSPNISPTTGLVRAPLPWMSAVPRRETSAPPEFVNYAQGTQTRLQQQHLQRGQRQQSQDYSKVPQAPSPVFKEAVVSTPPVVYQHPGGGNLKLGDSGRSTLPRHHKPSAEKTLSGGPALRPWAVKHQEYQQQKLSLGNPPTVDLNRARYQQSEGQQPQAYSYGQSVQTPPSSGGGSRWPEVQPPSFLRQSSTETPAVKNPSSTGSKVRIVPIVIEQDSSSETEHAYGSADSSTPTYALNSGTRNINPQSVGRFTGSPSPKSPPSQGQSPISPPTSKWSPGQPPFKVVRPSQQPAKPPQTPQSTGGGIYYNNPIGMYSEGNAVEALQQMQQSLAQLNSGLQNAYPKFINEKINNSLPTRGVDSPAPVPDSAPVQSRSFRVLQQVVDHEASGSDDEIRGYMSQDGPEAPISYQTAQSKTFTGPSKGRGHKFNNSVQSPLARQNYPEQFGRDPQGGDHGSKGVFQQQQPPQQQTRGFGNNSSAIPSRAFRALQQHTNDGAAGPGESDL